MNNSDMPATAMMTKWKADSFGQASNTGYEVKEYSVGLTKREAFAMAAMQGYTVSMSINTVDCEDIAKMSVYMADALLKELEGK